MTLKQELSMKTKWLLYTTCSLFVFTVSGNAQFTSYNNFQQDISVNNYISQSLVFIENKGQFGNRTLFKANVGENIFYFCRDAIVCQIIYNMYGLAKHEKLSIVTKFIDANPNARVTGLDQLPYMSNYFLGNDPSLWRKNVLNYSAIIYRNIYPGIDFKYYGDKHSIKYDLIVHQGANISEIKIDYQGVNEISVSSTGELIINTALGLIYEKFPYCYQEINGIKKEIKGRYVISDKGYLGFWVDSTYNPLYTLIIDPEISFSTFLGGTDWDIGQGICADVNGYIYVTGGTTSSDFPTANPYDENYHSGRDVFIAKYSPFGDSLLYSTYLGGFSDDMGYRITADNQGRLCLAGYTCSPDFPISNAYDPTFNGNRDVFLAKLSANGDSLIFSTFLGGSEDDRCYRMEVDHYFNMYVSGYTYSSDYPLVNAFDNCHNGGADVFVSKLSASGESLLYSTFLGGSGTDYGLGLTVDSEGFASITGFTNSSDFPTEYAFDPTYNGSCDAFAAKLSQSGNELIYSTYLGGSYDDNGYAIDVDIEGNAYITGGTYSYDFPAFNSYDSTFNGGNDIFLIKISPWGNVEFSTFIGGSCDDYGDGIAVDNKGCAFISGRTASPNFPTVNPFDNSYNGYWDVFVLQFSSQTQSLEYSTFLGGSYDDCSFHINIDYNRDILVTGYTESPDFPTVNAYDFNYNGSTDVFITKFSNTTGFEENISIPDKLFQLYNYPNPFNSITIIEYSLPRASFVTIEIYDLMGRKIETIIDQHQKSGYYHISWDASYQTSGIYYCVIKDGEFIKARKMMLIK